MTTRPAEASPISSPAPHGDRPDARGNGGPTNSTGAGADPSSNVTLRALVSGREAGIIIGKGGKVVADLREATGTKAGVSKAVLGVHDRVFSVSGGLDGVSKAFHIVADAILQNPVNAMDPALVAPPSSPATSTTIRLLISHNLMGSIIGKAGSKIKEIQDLSGVRMVATKEMLPQSTERIVEVQGSPESIQVAVFEIGKCLMEDWERASGTVLYQPGAIGTDGSTTAYSGGSLGGGYSGGGAQGNGSNRRPSGGNSYGGSGYRKREWSGPWSAGDGSRQRTNFAGASGPTSAPLLAENLRTQNISIPSDMVGCIIGKGGSKINEIRRLSGSKISIAKLPHDASGERMFTITGTPEENEQALYLLYNQLESEKERRVHSVEEEQ